MTPTTESERMMIFKKRRVYVFRDGTLQETGLEEYPQQSHTLHGFRDKRKLMFELTECGDINLFFKDAELKLTFEQMESINRFRRDNRR